MDKIYIGDIPTEYHFARFGNGYIDLYDSQVLHNNSYTYYRIYTNDNGFYYSTNIANYNQYITEYAQPVDVTNEIFYRTDFPNIMIMTFIFVLFGIFLFNIVTSLIRKGGLLGGLL